MFQVITEQDYSEFSRKQIGEYSKFERALEVAQKAIRKLIDKGYYKNM